MHENLGTAFVDGAILSALELLWNGPLSPADLDKIELGIRALIVSPKLVASQIRGHFDLTASVYDYTCATAYEPPFRDHLLDYEFEIPEKNTRLNELKSDEKNFLEDWVSNEFRLNLRNVLSRIDLQRANDIEDIDFVIREWCLGNNIRGFLLDKSDENILSNEELETLIYFFTDQAETHAEYFVRCHRDGMIVYSDSPIGNICKEFIFSKWPNHLFENFHEEYMKILREIRGPGIGVDLPPLVNLVLSRARTRTEIPAVLRDLREEYGRSRIHLWDMLGEMWKADSIVRQIKILRQLEGASSALFKATFKEKFDALSLALDLAQCSVGGVVSVGQKVLAKDRPNARISALSFAKKLSADYLNGLLNNRKVLKHHLSTSELTGFGID